MRSPRKAIGLWLVVVAGLGSTVSAAEPTAAGVWKTDFTQAQAEAQKLDRPILLHFYAEWCVPCRDMDRESLRSPELLRMLQAGYVAVKVDLERQPELGQRFKVVSMPTDIVISPDGRVLSQVVGYQKKDEYLTTITRIEAKYAEGRKVHVARTVTSAPPANPPEIIAATPPSKPAAPPLPETPLSAQSLPPQPVDAPQESPAVAAKPSSPADVVPEKPVAERATEKRPPELALDGYCPVTLFTTRSWRPGMKEISYEHQGQLFHFASEKQLDSFKADPSRFAPRLLGCDPVVLSETNIAVPGTTRFGAYFEGELYLFESAATRNRFRGNPVSYTRTKHVLKPDDVQRRRG